MICTENTNSGSFIAFVASVKEGGVSRFVSLKCLMEDLKLTRKAIERKMEISRMPVAELLNCFLDSPDDRVFTEELMLERGYKRTDMDVLKSTVAADAPEPAAIPDASAS